MEGKSEITPFAESETIADKLEGLGIREGNSIVVNLKIPLTTNTMGHFELNDIMETDAITEIDAEAVVSVDQDKIDTLPAKKKNWFQRQIKKLEYNFYNAVLGFGIANKVSYATKINFAAFDPKYFKEVRVKKIFFALEPCGKKEKDCLQREANKSVSFKFLDKLFVNLSTFEEGEVELDKHGDIKNPLNQLDTDNFSKKVNRAWGKQPRNFKLFKDKNGDIPDHVFKNITIAKTEGDWKKKKNTKNIRDNGNVFIARVEKDRLIHVKELFENNHFDGIIKDLKILKNSIYIELYHSQLRKKFFKNLRYLTTDIKNEGIEDLSGCTNLNCASLNVNQIDLVPMLIKNKKIQIDTFLSLKKLNYNDFKYSGYIEIDVKLELPKI
jgi:hypothetical protein